eukprot:SAG22_NODE_11666_length_474_cov_1.458667_1_plen_35_part_10
MIQGRSIDRASPFLSIGNIRYGRTEAVRARVFTGT